MRNNLHYEEEISAPLEPIRFSGRRMVTIHSENDLDNYILRTILDWAKDDYVCPNALFNYICKATEPPWFHNKIEACRNWRIHIDIIQRIDASIRAMLTLRPAVTFYDVLKVVEQICPDHRSKVGPLQSIPIVKQSILSNYNLRQMTPEIRLSDLISDCADFINIQVEQRRLPCDEAVIMALSDQKFLHFLKEKHQKSSIKELGVKITNFPALRDAVHVHKIDNYLKDMKSKKLTKLLRAEITFAMTNIINKLKSTKVFPKESVAKNEIEKFASLPFPEAVEKFFRPFLDEEERIFSEHDLERPAFTKEEDPLSVVRSLFQVLKAENVYGPLFHLSAVIGAVHEAKSINQSLLSVSDRSFINVRDLSPSLWKQEVFIPLLRDIEVFLLLCIDDDVRIKNLTAAMTNIIDKCTSIISMLKEPIDLDIVADKRRCLASLSLCCQATVDCYKGQVTLADPSSFARLQVDLLPQMFALVVNLLSKSVLLPQQEGKTATTVSRKLVDIVYAAVKANRLSPHTDGKLALDGLLSLEAEMLDALQVPSWPLAGSFLDYVLANDDSTLSISQKNSSENKEKDKSESGPCLCLAMSQQFLISRLQRLPDIAEIDLLDSEVLQSQYGLLSSPRTRRQIEEAWKQCKMDQGSLMGDGRPVVIDLKTLSLSKKAGRPPAAVTDVESVMATLAEVGLLEDVCGATNWNSLYRHHWGDVAVFLQQNMLLAARFNVRVLETERGRLRANVIVTESDLREAASELKTSFRRSARLIVGLFVSAFVADLAILESIVGIIYESFSSFENTSQIFSDFVEVALSIAPSEVAVELFTRILRPLGESLFLAEATSEIQRALSSVPISTIDLLRQSIHDDLAFKNSATRKVTLIPAIVEMKSTEIEEIHKKEIIVEEKMELNEEKSEESASEGSREIVEEIRRSEFGVGRTDDLVIDKFNQRMARLVEHFSSDLYANPTHFILELIQNADDNRYPPECRPSLYLNWQQSADGALTLSVSNNEVGFCAEDLRSLCDIGASTKLAPESAHRPDKIGRKGIGFKSVFLVSDRPEVHSNGFHVRFNRFNDDDTPSNALVPTWISDSNSPRHENSTGTKIILPIIDRLRSTLCDSVGLQLHPSLLLFLRRLKVISMTTDTEDASPTVLLEMVDSECSADRKVVRTADGTKHSWFLWTRRYNVDDERLRLASPRGLHVTEVSIAVPLYDDGSGSQGDLPAFAFLPIRSYGLRFIVNADFTIPASREDVAGNCAWNRWLVEQAADVFVHSVRARCSLSSSSSSSGRLSEVARVVDCVPLPGEVPGDCPFGALVPRLRAQLALLPWLPDEDGRLYRPSQLITQAGEDRALTRLLCLRLNMSFLHPAIDKGPTEEGGERRLAVLRWLGCQALSLEHLASLLAALLPEDLADPAVVRAVVTAVHCGLPREHCPNAVNRVLSLLRATCMWPLLSGETVTLDAVAGGPDDLPPPIFLPPASWLSSPPLEDAFRTLRRVISPSFLAQFHDCGQGGPAAALLRRLGVPELSPAAMVTHALLPRLPSRSRQWLVAAHRYLAAHCAPQQHLDTVSPFLDYPTISVSKDGLRLSLTPHARIASVHLPLSIDPSPGNILTVLGDRLPSYTVLDDGGLSGDDPAIWLRYFVDCGVSRSFSDWEEVAALLALDDGPSNEALLGYLDGSWRAVPPSVMDGLAGFDRPWVPTTDQGRLCLPTGAVYQVDGDVARAPACLQGLLPVCRVLFASEALPRRLGMAPRASASHAAALLGRLLGDGSTVTTEQVRAVYAWLATGLTREEAAHVCSEVGPRLVVPAAEEGDPCEVREARACFWSLPLAEAAVQSREVAGRFRDLLAGEVVPEGSQRALSGLFPDLRDLFVEVIGVPQYPSLATVAPAVDSSLALLTPDRLLGLNEAEVDLLADVYNLLHRLAISQPNEDGRPEMSRLSLLPCMSGRYRCYADAGQVVDVFSWRNRSTVEAFLSLQSTSIDFLSFNPFALRNRGNGDGSGRLTAPQFLAHYCPLPVLEDHIDTHIDNRMMFVPCAEVRTVFAHIEPVLSQWVQRRGGASVAAAAVRRMAMIGGYFRGPEEVRVRRWVRGHPDLFLDRCQAVYIGPGGADGEVEMLVGGFGEHGGLEMLEAVLRALADWLLDGDAVAHLKNLFRTFSRSLLDHIEGSNRIQVSSFLISHQLRVNPFCIDYIYGLYGRERAELAARSPLPQVTQDEQSVLEDGEDADQEEDTRPETPPENIRKRKSPLNDENAPSPKQARMDAAQQSGRLGERLTRDRLLTTRRLGDSLEVLEVKWINEHEETRWPYDFKLRVKRIDGDSSEPEWVYLEVKATSQPDKRQFEISAQEVTASWSFQSKYHLMLVFHGGSAPAKFVHIADVLGQMQEGQCKLLVDVGAILD